MQPRQILLLAVLTAVLVAAVAYKVEHAEAILIRVEHLPNLHGQTSRHLPANPHVTTELVELLPIEAFIHRQVVFREPARDLFAYVVPKPRPRPKRPRPKPVPPPAASPKPPPRRINRSDVVIHGFHEDKMKDSLQVFLSYKDELFMAQVGTVLPGNIRVKSVTSTKILIQTTDGAEQETFDLP